MEESKSAAASLSHWLEVEEESSQKQQLQCFFNYVLLGQWELARATARLICQNPFKEDSNQVLQALLDLATNPYEQSGGSGSVTSPEHLSWLALQEYEICAKSEDQASDTSAVRQDVEFRLLLAHECGTVEESTLHEVYQYFQKHHGASQAFSHLAAFDSRESLPKVVAAFLKQKLRDQPATGHHLISLLMPKKRMTDNRESEALQALYIHSMNALIDSLPASGDKREETCEKIFQLLAFYDPEPYWNYLQIRQLFNRLLALGNKDSSHFNPERIMEALMGRTRGYLMDEFGKLLHEQSVSGGEETPSDLSEEHQLTLNLLTGDDRHACWQRFFVACLKWNKHCLGLILETCISLVTAERFETVGQFLSAPELQRLKPVVLLACWTYCHSSDSARRLLDTLWTSVGVDVHPALSAGCKKLAYQLSLIKWCMERARPLLESSESVSSQPSHGDRATRLLHGLETHSVLYVLHQSTQLAALNSQEVLHLLQNVARGGGDGEKKKPKSVHFQDDSQSHESKEPITAEQEHDICIYRSYCAIKCVMDAMVFCFENSDLDLMNPVRIKNILKPRHLSRAISIETFANVSSSEGEESSTPSSGAPDKSSEEGKGQTSEVACEVTGTSFKETYHRQVWQRIQQAREHLQHLYPLAYRVEILENIFSLLFCRHSDLQDGAMMMEGVSDDEADGESKADSMENLSMSVISEEDAESDRFSNSLKETTSTSSSLVQQTDSAIGSLGTEGKSHRSDSVEYDTPFQEQKSQKDKHQRKFRSKDHDSSDNARRFSGSSDTCGFLANDYIVRDVLAMLKDALLDLNAMKFKKMGAQSEAKQVSEKSKRTSRGLGSNKTSTPTKDLPADRQHRSPSPSTDRVGRTGGTAELDFNPALENLLSQTVSTSITPDMLQKRVAQLTQHIHEAQWRFQLVAHEQIPRQAGCVLEDVVMVTDDDSHVACVYEEWMSPRRSKSTDVKPVQSGKAGRRRTVSSGRVIGEGSLHPSQQSIIARMLSSPDSLLTMSLTRNNFAQASQIVKLLKINEKSRGAAEATFTEAFNSTAKTIGSLSATAKESQAAPASKKFSLQAIKNAAAAGVANARLSEIVDGLLANPNIPPLPRPHWVSDHGQENVFASFFHVDMTTAVLMDLACTTCQSWELCSSLFNIIKTKGHLGKALKEKEEQDDNDSGSSDPVSTKEKKKGKNSFIRCDLKGTHKFFQQMDALLQVGHGDSDHWIVSAMHEVSAITGGSSSSGKVNPVLVMPAPTTHGAHAPVTVQQSLLQRFRSTASPLVASGVKLYENTVHDIQVHFEQTNQALLASSRLDRQDSIHIDESHFEKSPAIKQSPLSFSPATSRTSSVGSGGSSWSREMQGKVEVPLLHQRMKHLIAVMEKSVPQGGLLSLLLRGKMEHGVQRNYLLSLYEHVKELAYVVALCESKLAETLILPKNYFSVLQEGPVDILGRLMFVKRVSPARLEKVASKLSLNLTHIIVQSCCPQIPSKHLPSLPPPCPQEVERIGARCVYNGGACTDSTASSQPDKLVRTILQDILRAMQEVSVKYNGRGIFTELCGRQLVKGEHYQQMITRVKSLQAVDLSLLDSREMRLCFFANLLNLMTIHYHLYNIKQCAEAQTRGRGEGFSSGLKGLDGHHLLDMVTKLGAFCYHVGQLGMLSLFDLKCVMMHHGQNLSKRWKSLIISGTHKLAAEDPMAVFMPPAEPRLLFVVSDGCLSSPPIQVLESDKLRSQLDSAAKSYLKHAVRLDPEKGQISLPLLLTALSLDSPVKKDSSMTLYDNLLNFVSINADPTQTQQLEDLTRGEEGEGAGQQETGSGSQKTPPPEVSLSDFSTDFGYVFKMEDVSVEAIQSNPAPEVSTPPRFPGSLHLDTQQGSTPSTPDSPIMSPFLPQHFLLESSGSQADSKVSMAEPASYQLTPVTLDYVRETSGLVATLLTLLCSDELDDNETHFTEDHFPATSIPRHRASSDISVVDIRSYRYHCLVDDFPILQRHLLTYIVPLAGADNPEISRSGDPVLKFVTNVIDEDVKVCMFSLHDSLQFLDMLHTMTSRLMAKRYWQRLIPVLRSIPEVVMETYPHLQLLHDFVVSCWAKEFTSSLPPAVSRPSKGGSPGSEVSLLHQLRRMYCPNTQARLVMAVCDRLPVDWGLDLLQLCLSQPIQPQLRSAVQAKLHHLTVYHKITSCLKTQQVRLSMQQPDITLSAKVEPSPAVTEQLQKLAKFEDWRYTTQMSQDDPREVMEVLIQAGDLGLTRDWARLHKLPSDMMTEIEVLYMVSLMKTGGSDTLPVYQALEDLRAVRPAECLEMCQHLLKRLDDQHKVKFIISYMLKHLAANLPPDELEDLRLRQIGAKALLCIPKSTRGEYSHLITCPHLILEQLLMNMKGELAGRVFENIREDFKEIKDSKLRVAQDQFNSLLTNYARKALEVTVVQTLDCRSPSSAMGSPRCSSAGSGSSKDEEKTPLSQRRGSEAVKVRKRNMDTSAPSKMGTTPPSTVGRRGSTISTTTTTPAPVTSTTGGRSGSTKFIMPVAPPTEDQWVPDSEASVCMVCKLERFSMFNRRHHCRRCGRVVCAACSTRRSQVRGMSARTCDECYEQMFGTRESRARDEQEVYSQRMKESLSGASPSLQSPPLGHMTTQLRPSDLVQTRSLSSVVHHDVHEWKLKTDEGLNGYIRDEFYYEQAPSVALCMSILQHHTDPHVSGQLILTMCDDLSTFLQPLAPGVPNLEVDYGLIISIIRELLFRAKMIFLKGGDSGMIGKCDAYQARVDLLKILLEANYPDLPTLQELSKMDTARRLRDKLLKDERLSLALEVCTKCGVEPTGVWLAWGRACLHCGDFAAARDKFAHCLKAPKDKNQTGASSRLLMEIIDLLESLPPTGVTEIQMLLSNPANLSSLINMPVPAQQDETSVESVVYQECTHYLRTYGTYADHLKFLLRNGYWNKALKFVTDYRCSPEVFVESILQPALKGGEMTRLIEQLLMLDSSLDQWMPHLTASCRYLLKNKYFHVLYNLQIFMKDFLRAAMTCINHFYQHGAHSYLDLAKRLQFLFIAQEHMQAFLDPLKWGAVRHPSVSPPSPIGGDSPLRSQAAQQAAAQMCMSKEDIARNIRVIALQIEVTQFLEQCLQGSKAGEAAAVATQFVPTSKGSSQIPTLFGNPEQRKDVIKMVLLSGGKLSVAFDLALRIFQELQMKAVAVLKAVVCEQLKQRRLSDMLDLLRMTEQQQVLDEDSWDEIVSTALLEITEKQLEARDETETLTKMIRKEHNKLNALIMTGKLRSAYLTAAKTNRAQDISRIMAAAERMGQAAVRNICKKWLEQHQKH
ncbi:uncharacterized protein LOC143280973 isoform X2 [Babylonia areolata]|uniref:uncharacterized protein LOC143280973 isoform X2 n=1 Tax=Babylonia areolata TaxID=304850 RepID=UPI003FD554F9